MPSESGTDAGQPVPGNGASDPLPGADPIGRRPDRSPESWSVPAEAVVELPMRRLHPTSLMFDIISHGRTYLFPILFGLFGAANGNPTILILSGLAFIPAVSVSIFRFLTYRYRIEADHLIVTQGLIFRKTRSVPVVRIQNIDLIQNLLHRLFSVAEARIETASGTEPEATLRVLSMEQVEQLREAVFAPRQQVSTATATAMHAESPVAEGRGLGDGAVPAATTSTSVSTPTHVEFRDVLRIPVSWLVKAGLASNRGLIMVGIVLGGFFQFDDNQWPGMFQKAYDALPAEAATGWGVAIGIALLMILMVLLRLLGIAWYVLRFFNYRLELRGDDLRISCGLITRISATVPRKRIQFISIHRSLFQRWMGLAAMRIETAGGSGEKQNATQSVSKRWFVPVLPDHEVARLMEILRPGIHWAPQDFDYQPLATGTLRRLIRLSIVESLLVALIGLIVAFPWGGIAGLAMLPLLILWARKKAASMRYARIENGVVYRSGVWTRKLSVTFFDRIQALKVQQSPFDRRWSMARLTIDTAAAGPADHVISVRYLDQAFAEAEFQDLRERTGLNQPVFE